MRLPGEPVGMSMVTGRGACAHCGEGFDAYGKRQYCSRECYRDAVKDPEADTTHECEGCGMEFSHKSNSANRYCTRECAFEHGATGPEPTPSTCQHCEGDFWQEESSAEWCRTYCSSECENQGRTHTCEECGEAYRAATPHQRYCGPGCAYRTSLAAYHKKREKHKGETRPYTTPPRRERVCCGCGTTYMGYHSSKWCRACAGAKYRRHQRRANVSKHIPYLLERDNKRCQLCHEPVAWTRSVPDSRAPTVDHIIPRSLGGGDELANLQLAHLVCNVRKGNGSRGSQLRCLG